jgi:hypothetical protein
MNRRGFPAKPFILKKHCGLMANYETATANFMAAQWFLA